MKSLDIVIPVYNSEKSLDLLINKLDIWVKQSTFKVTIIFVNDLSTDGTLNKLTQLVKLVSFDYQIIKLAQNYGQHTATAVGFNYAQSDYIATIDDDLQHEIFELDNLFSCLLNTNSDLVYGHFKTKKHYFFRNLGTKVLQIILKLGGRDYSMVTSYRMMKKSVIAVFKTNQSKIYFIDDFLLLGASKVNVCTVNHTPRIHGDSGYSFLKLSKMAITILLLHSSIPLKIISRMGLVMAFCFFVLGCFYIYQKLAFDVEIGFTSLIVAIFFSTGLILFSLGIIGEYIRRIWVSKQNLDKVIIAEIC